MVSESEVRERSGTERLFIDIDYLQATLVGRRVYVLRQSVFTPRNFSRSLHGGAARRTFVYRVHRGG